jgi:uncharacterized 2Fe-2S/4Fe-4S cluster protein (DUF4445 family)
MSAKTVRVQLEPLSAVVEVPQGALLSSTLAQYGIEFPCGGSGLCGGCRVRVLEGSLAATDADSVVFSPEELATGWRLACQARAEIALVLECTQWQMEVLADDSGLVGTGKTGLGIAVDLGTTTIAAQLIDLSTGDVLGVTTGLNPQTPFGSDVMQRIQAALSGSDLTHLIRQSVGEMVATLALKREAEVHDVVLVGNTIMHHLFAGLNVEPLSHVPFQSPQPGAVHFEPRDLGWALPADSRIRFERCLGGFVGSDMLAGIIAIGMGSGNNPVALIDLGTNGEIAIGDRHGIVCASAAAGPAFEAGAISMGMRAAAGAISRVSLSNGDVGVTVIGKVEARGICGSGLVDAVAVNLANGVILPSGRISNGTKLLTVKNPVVLFQSDIRELQLAKGAIACGFRLLLKRQGIQATDLESICLAGAFGNYVQVESALAIGLIEAPRHLIRAAGNTALRGAKMMLLMTEEPVLPRIEHVSLASDEEFQDQFADCMAFPTSVNATLSSQ